jgi:DNA-binding PadR family transcriptional regulator
MEPRRPLTPLSFQILVALADRPRHGYGIVKEIEEAAGEALSSSTGTLYLALQRLEEEGLVEEEQSTDPRRRVYRLTTRGRALAAAEARRLLSLLGSAREKKLLPARQLESLLKPSVNRKT